MTMKLFFCMKWICAAGRFVIENIGGAKRIRYCVFAVVLQYFPLSFEAAPLTAEVRSETLDSQVDTLTGYGNGSNGVVTPVDRRGWNGGDGDVNGGAECRSGKGQPACFVSLRSKLVNGKPTYCAAGAGKQQQVSSTESDPGNFHLALLCFFGPQFFGMLWYLWRRPTEPSGKTPND